MPKSFQMLNGFQEVERNNGESIHYHEVFYGRTTLGPFSMPAASRVPSVPGPFGLVLICPGTGGGRLSHRGAAVHIAEGGDVVATPENVSDNWRDDRFTGTSANWQRRPCHLGVVLD